MNKDNYTMIAYPQKPVIASTISTNTTTSTDMAELEQLRKENESLKAKLEKYVLKECMRRKVKELYDKYGFDMIIKAIRSLFTEDDEEDD